MPNIALKRRISLLIVIAVAVMIFIFSAQEGEDSADLSNGVTQWVLSVTVPGFNDFTDAQKLEYLDRAGFWVRKCAHFSEFALLAAALVNYLRYVMLGSGFARIMEAAWGIATLYACTDELHQMFVGGRGPAIFDVCVDSAGALAGALVGAGAIWMWHNRRSRLA